MSTFYDNAEDDRIARENDKLNMAYAEGRKDEREASYVDELVAAAQAALVAWNRLYPMMHINIEFEDCEFREMNEIRRVLTKLEKTK